MYFYTACKLLECNFVTFIISLLIICDLKTLSFIEWWSKASIARDENFSDPNHERRVEYRNEICQRWFSRPDKSDLSGLEIPFSHPISLFDPVSFKRLPFAETRG